MHRTNPFASGRLALGIALGLAAPLTGAATYLVTNNNDAGEGSLRQAMLDAEASPGADTIECDVGLGTITVTSGMLPIVSQDLTIEGNGTTVSGNNLYRVFFVQSGDVALNHLNIADGRAKGGNGTDGSGGGGGLGGGLFVNGGEVVLANVQFANNWAIGGNGGDAYDLGGGGGGGGMQGAGGTGAASRWGGGGGGGFYSVGGDGSVGAGGDGANGGGGGGGGEGGYGGEMVDEDRTGFPAGEGGAAVVGGSPGSPGTDGVDGTLFFAGAGGAGGDGGFGGGGGSGGGGGITEIFYGIAGDGGPGGHGGFGGGGGSGGFGNYSNLSLSAGGDGGTGGFGGGGGSGGWGFDGLNPGAGGPGGFGGGNGTGGGNLGSSGSGGGGAGLGGAIFVNAANGGKLSWKEGSQTGGGVTAGMGGDGGANATSASAGQAAGVALFLRGGTVYLTVESGSQSIAGDIADAEGETPTSHPGSISKLGAGTLVLSGNNTYAGSTKASEGTLLVNGSLAPESEVTVELGATLGGTGTIGGPTLVKGTLAPGVSPGILSSGDVGFASGSTFAVDIDGPTVGTGYDRLNVTGSVDLGGATLALAGGHVPAIAAIFLVIDNDEDDPVTGTFGGLPEGATVTLNGVDLGISYQGGDGNDVTLTRLGLAAATDSLHRPTNTRVVKALLTDLLANDTNPGLITAVANAEPPGSTVAMVGAFAVYTAPTAFAGSGSFEYTLDDGVTSLTGTVMVIETAPLTEGAPANAARVTMVGSDVVLVFIGAPGRTYRVQYTNPIPGPPYTWQDFAPPADLVAPASGVFTYTDLNPGDPARLYRAVLQL